MESYRLKSKLVESDREYLIQTSNDSNAGIISSEVFVDGLLTETVSHSHPSEINPEEVLSLLKLAHGEKKQEIEMLLDAYRRAISRSGPGTLVHLGTAFFFKRLYPEAQKLLAAAVASDPENHQALNFLGMTELALDNLDSAVKHAQQAVACRPGYADYRNNLGEALLTIKAYESAISEFEEAIKLNLYYADAHFNLGLALLQAAAHEQDAGQITALVTCTQDCFKKARLICTDYEAGLFDSGIEALHGGEFKTAVKLLTETRDAKKEKHRLEFSGFYMKFVLDPRWMSEQAIVERIKYLEMEIEKNPTYVDLYADLSRCYLEQAKQFWKKGVEQYRKTVELNPSLQKASSCLADAETEYERICASLDAMSRKG